MIAAWVETTFFLTTAKLWIPEDNFMKLSIYGYVVVGFKFVVLYLSSLHIYLVDYWIHFLQSLCTQISGNSESTFSWSSSISRGNLPRFHVTGASRNALFPGNVCSCERLPIPTRGWRRQHVDHLRAIPIVKPESPIISGFGSFTFLESWNCQSEVAQRRKSEKEHFFSNCNAAQRRKYVNDHDQLQNK